MRKVMVVLGTRPEAIKLSQVIAQLREAADMSVTVCSTGQHADMVQPVADLFGFTIDRDFGIMKPNQTLNHIASATMSAMDVALATERPDFCIVQGDTSTTFAAAMAAFYARVPVAHVEAGLRTGNMASPWPEEANRVLVTRIADLHFAPTSLAARRLIQEGVDAERVYNVGNTVIDAAHAAAHAITSSSGRFATKLGDIAEQNSILFTMHRRESIGEPMERAFAAIAQLARNTGAQIIFPMHPNPKVREGATRFLDGIPNVLLCEPLDYDELIHVLCKCRMIITDSGGIVEEAAAFNKPVLVLRDTTERTEAVDAGSALLCGTDPALIHRRALELLTDSDLYRRMTSAPNPFGDGTASLQIVAILRERLSK